MAELITCEHEACDFTADAEDGDWHFPKHENGECGAVACDHYLCPQHCWECNPKLCWSRGPRIGNEGVPYCKQPEGHEGLHFPPPEDGWEVNLAWGKPDMCESWRNDLQ